MSQLQEFSKLWAWLDDMRIRAIEENNLEQVGAITFARIKMLTGYTERINRPWPN